MSMLQSQAIEFDLQHRSIRRLDSYTYDIDPDPTKIYWIHCDLNDHTAIKTLASKLHLPDYLSTMCVQNDLLPKLIDNSETVTMQVQYLSGDSDPAETISFSNLIIHLTPKFCFTASADATPAILHFIEVHPRSIQYAQSPCFILFLLLDDIINSYSEMLLEFDENSERIDLRIREFHDESYSDLVAEEKKIMKVKRYAAALQDILMRITGRRIEAISEQCQVSLSNLFNHSQMIVREAEAVRDNLKGSLAQIDNALMHRMNSTMKVLTSFAAIFLPLSLIAGIYGMNFEWMPELHWKYGYFMVLGFMGFCAAILIYIFKRNKWF